MRIQRRTTSERFSLYLKSTNAEMMWWLKFSLLIVITVGVTWMIVWLDSSFKKRGQTASSQRGFFRGIVYFLLNLRDIF
jgi:hypothetical protein